MDIPFAYFEGKANGIAIKPPTRGRKRIRKVEWRRLEPPTMRTSWLSRQAKRTRSLLHDSNAIPAHADPALKRLARALPSDARVSAQAGRERVSELRELP